MQVLKLDSSFRPVQIISCHDAFCMVYMGRANLIEVYKDKYLHSAYESFPMPCVISLNRYVKISKITLTCNRKNVFSRDKNICQYCAKEFSSDLLTMDHVTPRCKGGPKIWENIVTSCRKCDQKKGGKLPHEAGMIPLNPPAAPPGGTFDTIAGRIIHPNWIPYLGGLKRFALPPAND